MDDKIAILKYLDNSFEIIENGTNVICAVSGKKIYLNDLTYWNVELQEAYYSYKEAFKKREKTACSASDWRGAGLSGRPRRTAKSASVHRCWHCFWKALTGAYRERRRALSRPEICHKIQHHQLPLRGVRRYKSSQAGDTSNLAFRSR